MKSDESWADLDDRVRYSKSGRWDQVCLSPEDFLQLMDERQEMAERLAKAEEIALEYFHQKGPL